MKHTKLAVFMILMMLFGSLAGALPVCAATIVQDGFTCTDGWITGYTGSAKDLIIPDTISDGINTQKVIGIFSNVFMNNSNLTSVTIPASVTSIGDDAFSWCSKLEKATFLGDVPSRLGNGIFDHASSAGFRICYHRAYETFKYKFAGYRLFPYLVVWFKSDNGTLFEAQIVEEGTHVKAPVAPTKLGGVFDGWYELKSNGMAQTSPSPLSPNSPISSGTLPTANSATNTINGSTNLTNVGPNLANRSSATVSSVNLPQPVAGSSELHNSVQQETRNQVLQPSSEKTDMGLGEQVDSLNQKTSLSNSVTAGLLLPGGDQGKPLSLGLGTVPSAPGNLALSGQITRSTAMPTQPVSGSGTLEVSIPQNGSAIVTSLPTSVVGSVGKQTDVVQLKDGSVGKNGPSQVLDSQSKAAPNAGFDFANTLISNDITLEAQWKPIATHTVTFDSAGGSAIAPQTVNEGSCIMEPITSPTKENYVFIGWYDSVSNTKFNFQAAITKDVKLMANWLPVGHGSGASQPHGW